MDPADTPVVECSVIPGPVVLGQRSLMPGLDMGN
jgi:hypothetical protein